MIPFTHPLTPEMINSLNLDEAKQVINVLLAQLKLLHQMNEEKWELIHMLQEQLTANDVQVTSH